MKASYDHLKLQLLPTLECIIVGQGRVVVVVINARYPSLSLKNKTLITPEKITHIVPFRLLSCSINLTFISGNIWDSSGKEINASEARKLKQCIPSAIVRYFPNCNGALLLVRIIPSSPCDVVRYYNWCDILIKVVLTPNLIWQPL